MTQPFYRSRDILPLLNEALANMPVVVLTGMRQAGKSTLLQEDPAFKNRRTVTLDDFAHMQAARENPDAFLGTDEPLTIDEAQRCPELLIAIKRVVDRHRTPGRFLLSGSANFTLLGNAGETLAGRAVYLSLHPFNLREMHGKTATRPFLIRALESPDPAHEMPKTPAEPVTMSEVLTGGMPTVCLGGLKNPGLWFTGYEQTYMDRDLRQLSQVADLLAFRRLLQLAALRTGQLLNVSDLGRDAKLNAPTAGRYLNLMETSFLIRRLAPYLGNRSSRLIKSPKIYMTDSGLCAHMAGIHDPSKLSTDPMRGALFETFVLQNIASVLHAHKPQANVMFWNVQGRHEVDFVVEAGRDVLAIEVKAAARWSAGDLAGLRTFLSATPNCKAAILAYNGADTVKLDEKLWAVPLRAVMG